MARMKGENWYKNARVWIAPDSDGIAKTDTIELRQKNPEGSIPITRWKIGDDERDDDSLQKKVYGFLEQAQNDANSSDGQGPFSYFLVALDDEGNITERSGFLKFFNTEVDESSQGDEPPTAKGLLGQLMRHNEAMMRSLVLQSGKTIDSLSNMLVSYQSREADMQAKQVELFTQLEEAYSEKHKRAIELLREETRVKQIDKISEQVMGFLPAIKARLLAPKEGGKVVTDASGKKIADILLPLIESLSAEQLEGLAGVIGMEKLASLSELANVLERIKDAEKAAN